MKKLIAVILLSSLAGCCTNPAPEVVPIPIPSKPVWQKLTDEQDTAVYRCCPDAYAALGVRDNEKEAFIDLLLCRMQAHNTGKKCNEVKPWP